MNRQSRSIHAVRGTLGRQHGLTFVELIVVVAILAIIASVGWPMYQSQQLKGRRSEAIDALTKARLAMDRCYSDNGQYSAGCLPASLQTSKNGDYGITLQIQSGGDAYSLVATAQGGQAADTQCNKFYLGNLGQKSAQSKSGSVTSKVCWAQ